MPLFARLPAGVTQLAFPEHPCAGRGFPSDIHATLTILDPAIAPVASIEQLNPVPRRRIVRR